MQCTSHRVDYSQEIDRAKLYDTITEMCYEYRERIILLPDENLDTIKDDFDKEVTLFSESKDYNLNFFPICNQKSNL